MSGYNYGPPPPPPPAAQASHPGYGHHNTPYQQHSRGGGSHATRVGVAATRRTAVLNTPQLLSPSTSMVDSNSSSILSIVLAIPLSRPLPATILLSSSGIRITHMIYAHPQHPQPPPHQPGYGPQQPQQQPYSQPYAAPAPYSAPNHGRVTILTLQASTVRLVAEAVMEMTEAALEELITWARPRQ
ncbi:hypothetical protein ColLi_09902 [Colletotrichum liriopes]|uniref:Uncharacterized protein n=1 Tax=Colletotrichum liriopes TaxID=708192 RepID=A0AA37GUH4_9PEZI|nr:hypothetical protein ColLi_09902 [Colletotrichum liriopes]